MPGLLYELIQYVENMKCIAVLFLKLLYYLYHEIQCDKPCNFVHMVHEETFEARYEIYSWTWSFKDTQALLQMINLHQIPLVCYKLCLEV